MVTDTPNTSGFTLLFKPLGAQRRYSLLFTINDPGKAPQQVYYELELSCTAPAASRGFLLQLQKKQIFINNKVPQSLLDMLADQCGKILYPLVVQVNAQGALQRIVNGDCIRKRWEEARPPLAQYYTGNIAEEMLAGMDAVVANDAFLIQSLQGDWLYALLFAPIHCPYENGQADATVWLPLIPYQQPLPYPLKLNLKGDLTRGGFQQVTATGICTDERSLADAIRGRSITVPPSNEEPVSIPPKGKAAFIWKVYPHDGTLFSVTGNCSLELPQGGEKKVAFEMYELQRTDALPAPGGKTTYGPSLIVEVTPVTPKKSWFSFLEDL